MTHKFIMTTCRKSSDSSEYKVETIDNTIFLEASNVFNPSAWTDKGLDTVRHRLKDTGNGIEVLLYKRKINLDYSELHDLKLLLMLWAKEHNQEFETFEVKKL